MVVDIQSKRIVWKVNGIVEAEVEPELFEEESTKFVPYIEMEDHLDSIRLIEDF